MSVDVPMSRFSPQGRRFLNNRNVTLRWFWPEQRNTAGAVWFSFGEVERRVIRWRYGFDPSNSFYRLQRMAVNRFSPHLLLHLWWFSTGYKGKRKRGFWFSVRECTDGTA